VSDNYIKNFQIKRKIVIINFFNNPKDCKMQYEIIQVSTDFDIPKNVDIFDYTFTSWFSQNFYLVIMKMYKGTIIFFVCVRISSLIEV